MSAQVTISREVGGSVAIEKGRFVKFGTSGDANKFVPVTALTDSVAGVALDGADPGQSLSVVVFGEAEIEVADANVGVRTPLRITATGRANAQLASGSQTAPTVAISLEQGVAEFSNGRARYHRCLVLCPSIPAVGA